MEGSGSNNLQPTMNSVSEGCCETSDVKEVREEEDSKLMGECGKVGAWSQTAKDKRRVFEVYWGG